MERVHVRVKRLACWAVIHGIVHAIDRDILCLKGGGRTVHDFRHLWRNGSPFGDHPLRLERCREDWFGPCTEREPYDS